ncbi:MAG: hypothetical protein Q4D12_06535 [Bacteroidales bacterium]|nr:hypothetical protein [Bacteroidales bacterium]
MEKNNELIQLSGTGSFLGNDQIHFAPDNAVPERMEAFHGECAVHQLTDGSFEVIKKRRVRVRSKLIHKLAHGRISKLKDGDIFLTIRIGEDESLDMADTILDEAYDASQALREYLSKY